MVEATSVVLSKLRIYETWKNAPFGALLQTRDRDKAMVVGLRCANDLGHGRSGLYFLVLEGANRGMLLEDSIRQYAVDVSSLLEISVSELSPQIYSTEIHDECYGLVCEHGAGTGNFCVRARSAGGVRGFVWLTGEARGRLETDKNLKAELIAVGMTEATAISVAATPD